jgi:hypothetical protein
MEAQMQHQFAAIEDIALSTRVRNALLGLQVRDIKQLATLTERDLLRSPNLGRKSLDEIHDLLDRHGLVLGMAFPPEPAPPVDTPAPQRAPFDLRACLNRRLIELEKLAEQGCASAANLVGASSLGFYGGTTNPRKARLFLIRAARGGSGLGAYNLGLLHLQGLGVTANARIAGRWFQRARRLGCASANTALAWLSPARPFWASTIDSNQGDRQ